ncbi:MAG: hypothetical protein ACLRPT_01290 [Akkermansia muciniphila]
MPTLSVSGSTTINLSSEYAGHREDGQPDVVRLNGETGTIMEISLTDLQS